MFRDNERRTYLAVLSLLTFVHVTSKGCTGNQPLVSGFHFSVLDYQMWSNSNDTTIYRPGSAFGEDSDNETLISYEGRIGADYYRGWCSEFNPSVQPFLQIDFKREVIIRQVETQGLQLNLLAQDAARYIRGFWLEYSTNITTSFVNVTLLNSSVAKIFSGQNDNDHTASVLQDLPQPITARIVRIYPTDSVPDTRFCLKLELHGCVPQREEECQSVYPLSCCSYGQPGDIINNVEVTSDDPGDSVPGPVTNILSYYDNTKFWCGDRNVLPANATFYFTEEVLLTSVAFHGLDGKFGDDYVTEYSWEYSVGNSTVKTYTDLSNSTIFENTREDKFQQTFWIPIHVQTLKFVAHNRSIRPCMAFQFFGCKLNEVILMSRMSATVTMSPSPTSTSDASITSSDGTIIASSSVSSSTPSVLTDSVTPQCSAVTVTSTVTPTIKTTSTVMVTSISRSIPMESPTPSPRGQVTNCIGDEEPLISGTRYYVNNNQLSASGHDPLHYTYDNMNERVSLIPEEGRVSNDYGSFLGWCSQKVTNIMKNAPYIQVEFDTQVVVSTVAVQGFEINGDKKQPRYVLEFQLAYKDLESEKFCTVNDENGLPMNFTGNSDTNYLDIMKSSLSEHIRAKVFRLYPISWISKARAVMNNNKMVNISRACLKWELYGCAELKTEVNNSCYQNSLKPSNVTSNSHDVVAMTSLLSLIDSSDNWCPSTEDINLPLVIDFYFAEVMLLTSVAMAGRKTNNGDYFVSSYSLSYASNTSCNLTLYEDLSGKSIFYNNHVRTFFHSFWEPIHVRRLRLFILDWHITACVSIGFFGCRSNDVNFNFTASSSEMAGSLPQDVCNAPANNVLLSCVNEERENFVASSNDSDNNVITIVAIVLPLLLASLLVIITVVLLYRRFKTTLRSAKLRLAVRNPVFMQSNNPLYESSKMKADGNYQVCFNRDQATVKLLNDDQSQHYSKLQHHRRDDGAFSSNPYNVLQPQEAQSYAQEGPKETATNVTYEEIPYHEITSKSDENQ